MDNDYIEFSGRSGVESLHGQFICTHKENII